MNESTSTPSAEDSPPVSFKELTNFVERIELLYALARRLSDAIANQPCEYLIREASMAFVKTMMSVLGFLRFIPSSRFYAKEVDRIIDLSSASVMARQVMEDALSFFYLSEPNLTSEQKKLRGAVWGYHGAMEAIEAVGFSDISPPDLPSVIAGLEPLRQFLEEPEALEGIDGN